MNWVFFIGSALGGGIVATLIGEAVRTRRAFRTALLLVRAELSRNATWIEQGKTPAAKPHKQRMFAPGRLATAAWDVQKPALAPRLWRKSHSLWAELSATYTILEAMSAIGEEPPDQLVGDLRSLEVRLGRADPTSTERTIVFLANRRFTRSFGIALATRLSREK